METTDDGRKTYQHRKQSLFGQIDSDGSGQIDKAEFGKLYDLIKIEAEQELAKEAALEKKAQKSERKVKMFACIAASLLVLLGISVAANFATSYMAADLMKDTMVDPKSPQGAITKDRDGHVVASGKTAHNMNLVDMPKLIDGKLPVSFYDNLKMVSFQGFDGKMQGLKITGWKWFSEADMVLEAGSKGEILITSGAAVHVYPTGKIKWAADGVTLININASTAWEAEAKASCENVGCPLSECSVYTSEFMGGLYSVKCDDIERWKYTHELAKPAARRKLIAPAVVMLAIRAAPVICEVAAGLLGPPTASSSVAGAVATVVGMIVM